MKVLIVCSGNSGFISPFIKEQAEALTLSGVHIDFFQIKGKGLLGYLSNFISLLKKNRNYKPNIIHAHYGLSGLLACLQFYTPVIVTVHGSDLMGSWYIRQLTRIAIFLSKHTIFVSDRVYNLGKKFAKNKYTILPCGINLATFNYVNKEQARKQLNLDIEKNYILFSSSFTNPIKNYPLAKMAIDLLTHPSTLIELKNYSRDEVNLLMHACDLLLVTSVRETGPLVVKEAMLCNLPIVSTDVGDVKTVISGTKNCFIVKPDIYEITSKIEYILKSKEKSNGQIKAKIFDNNTVAIKINQIYTDITK
jgi:glycosyltransferase involved in cell wall biosynthesis